MARSSPVKAISLALALALPGLSFADVTLPNYVWDMRLSRAMGPDLVVNRLVGDNAYPFRLFCWRSQDAEPRYAGVAIPAGLTVRQVTTSSLIPVPDSVCRAWVGSGG